MKATDIGAARTLVHAARTDLGDARFSRALDQLCAAVRRKAMMDVRMRTRALHDNANMLMDYLLAETPGAPEEP